MKKEHILAHLTRRLREITDTDLDHEAMARAGLSYADRQARAVAALKEVEKHRPEAEALSIAIDLIREHYAAGTSAGPDTSTGSGTHADAS